ncbi:MAG: hypothetical protein COU11_00255 [Candidatus Harrisonbacteria bacterium CG10_big_fil_rev_8_21_14_0_10_49_15]|uniref:Uncharacterized protein n=1 Tax=Candidatus Harrisonbacteria bacterium CG10_big_fil_rev_8_21_14_0_10_49_15 TaxID=1974587 RepID=A0A2H0UM27_9BACT|nr:MAG: hypothetical protein COU11_00255 [Candidatus Harrisonbacteria bacterium CG10_big_fil_rev_8_21_14_0_10_49_15]
MNNNEGVAELDLPSSSEAGKEDVPSPEEVAEIFAKLLEGKEAKEIQSCEDEKGPYLRVFKVLRRGEDKEYLYMRKGRYAEGSSAETAIYAIFFNEAGEATGAEILARYIGGQWEINPWSTE